MVQSGCKDCKERHMGCHSTCESYKKYQEENNRAKQQLRKSTSSLSLNSNGTMYSGRQSRRKVVR